MQPKSSQKILIPLLPKIAPKIPITTSIQNNSAKNEPLSSKSPEIFIRKKKVYARKNQYEPKRLKNVRLLMQNRVKSYGKVEISGTGVQPKEIIKVFPEKPKPLQNVMVSNATLYNNTSPFILPKNTMQPNPTTQSVQTVQSPMQPLQTVQTLQTVHPVQNVQPTPTVQSISPMQTMPSVQNLQPVQLLHPVQSIQSAQPLYPLQTVHPIQQIQAVQPLPNVQSLQSVQTVQPMQIVKICNQSGQTNEIKACESCDQKDLLIEKQACEIAEFRTENETLKRLIAQLQNSASSSEFKTEMTSDQVPESSEDPLSEVNVKTEVDFDDELIPETIIKEEVQIKQEEEDITY